MAVADGASTVPVVRELGMLGGITLLTLEPWPVAWPRNFVPPARLVEQMIADGHAVREGAGRGDP